MIYPPGWWLLLFMKSNDDLHSCMGTCSPGWWLHHWVMHVRVMVYTRGWWGWLYARLLHQLLWHSSHTSNETTWTHHWTLSEARSTKKIPVLPVGCKIVPKHSVGRKGWLVAFQYTANRLLFVCRKASLTCSIYLACIIVIVTPFQYARACRPIRVSVYVERTRICTQIGANFESCCRCFWPALLVHGARWACHELGAGRQRCNGSGGAHIGRQRHRGARRQIALIPEDSVTTVHIRTLIYYGVAFEPVNAVCTICHWQNELQWPRPLWALLFHQKQPIGGSQRVLVLLWQSPGSEWRGPYLTCDADV